ncbi:metalloprotease [Salegentibacter sp. F188]|uniref:Metalloprotease n=1 Tax=Autumnicola patrickiae TaxID=3075591 RepID=A0ABU3E1E9_9FLAO|nr:metalloprotease [Salegentibacter sp. F188]MDT0689775.1 metalloprotease [Salegentibacter sp. F188]
MKHFLFPIFLLACTCVSFAQHSISIEAKLDAEVDSIFFDQVIEYENQSNEPLTEIYLNDWINAFSSKSSYLGKRFSEEFVRRFHFAGEEERGGTVINAVTGENNNPLQWERLLGRVDIIRIPLSEPLAPGEKTTINLDYAIKVPQDKFTRYGKDGQGNYKLRYWYITPAVYNDGWKIYSHQNLDLDYTPPADIEILLNIPNAYYAASALNMLNISSKEDRKIVEFVGQDRVETKLYLTKTYLFENIYAHSHEIITNLTDDNLQTEIKEVLLNRILSFLEERLGSYPHNHIFVTQEDYHNSPLYGLNQLPGFIRPFPDGFQYDIKQFKTITNNYLKNTLLLDPRTDQWVNDAILVSLMMDYVDHYYPKMKLIGNLSDIIGIRWFHAADLEFNDQYQFMYMNSARLNFDQALTTRQDSLVKFNKNIANSYKAGIGLRYIEDYLGSDAVKESITEFYRANKLQPTSKEEFKRVLQKNAAKDISWFFEDYVNTNKKIDFSIKKVKKKDDSLVVTVRNRRNNDMPVSVYGIKDGEIVSKTWVEEVEKLKKVTIPREGAERVAVNYEQVIPEINQRNNYKAVTTLFNKPIQFRLLEDVEDPRYNQLFFMPEFDYNLYDGISIGPKLYNASVLNKNFNFKISPKYGFNSETIVGSASISNAHQYENSKLYAVKYGFSGTRFSYGYNLFYEKFTPFLTFAYRSNYLRSNERQFLMIRNINVKRDIDPVDPINQPNYNVFNVNYSYNNPNIVNFYKGSFDYQLAEKFSKISLSLEYRKLFKNNRQVDLRFFAGTFLYNDTRDHDYFSFALDRPTDYLFDYNYYGRSQGSGLYSQQIIPAEGGFKSQLEPEFANQWITTFNASTNIWNWIYVYGDVGLVKNQYDSPAFLYDTGIRASLVADYFELFFPVYSNLGWEIAQPSYDEKIRFIVSLDINTLLGLFKRRWY